jgi:hypothetical protein
MGQQQRASMTDHGAGGLGLQPESSRDGRGGMQMKWKCWLISVIARCNASCAMPPHLTPPVHLDLHGPLVTLTPVLLAAGASLALALVGDGRGGRILGWLALGIALALQALFLLPRGAVASAGEPMVHGLVCVGWGPTGMALALGAWAAWRWRLHAGSLSPRGWTWCLRVALALALPVVALPVVALGCEGDRPPAAVPSRARWWRMARVGLAVTLTVVVLAALPVPSGARLARSLTAANLLALGVTAGNGWRMSMVFAALVMALP